MNAPHRIWRHLRSLLVLICAGGAVLAADKTWLSNLPFDFEATDWWANVAPAETRTADPVIASEPANHRAPELSMDRLLNGLLFSKPSTGWRLTPEQTAFATTWLTQQSSSDNFARPTIAPDYLRPTLFSSEFVNYSAASFNPLPADPNGAPVGTWISSVSGNWSTPSNWSGNSVPSGSNVTVHFDALNIASTVTVTLDTSRTIGDMSLGDTNGTDRYDIAPGSGTSLTFNNAGAASSITQVSTSAGDTISVPLLVKNDLNVNNASSAHPVQISGSIASSAEAGTLQNLNFNSGAVNISGDISDGSTGAKIRIHVNGGTLNLSGDNTYSGMTFVAGGTLFVKGDNSGATGIVEVSGAGSVLSGTGTIGGAVNMFDGIITGGSTTEVGQLTLKQNVTIVAGDSGGTPTYLANLSGDTSDLLAITGTLHLGTGTTLHIDGPADGLTTYTLATFASITGVFDTVIGLPSNYDLVYLDTELDLVPTAVPEPATWIGGALALGAIVFAKRKRKKLKR